MFFRHLHKRQNADDYMKCLMELLGEARAKLPSGQFISLLKGFSYFASVMYANESVVVPHDHLKAMELDVEAAVKRHLNKCGIEP